MLKINKYLIGLIIIIVTVFSSITIYNNNIEKNNTNNIITVVSQEIEAKAKQLPKNTEKHIRNLNLNSDRIILLNNEITGNIFQIIQTLQVLNKISNEPIFLVINSPGGSVLAGALLISAIQASKSPVYTICYGICASMAAMIHQYGVKRYAIDRSVIMFHPASGGAQGEIDKMVNFLSTIQRYVLKIELDVAKRIGISIEEYKKNSSIEWWLDAEDALKNNVIDEIVFIKIPNFDFNAEEENKKSHRKNIWGDFTWKK